MEEKYKRFVNYKVVVCLLHILHSCNFFLIEPDNIVKPNTNGTSQCLSINEFLAEKKEFNHQINQLKYDNDQTLTILTEQLKHKLTFLESKLGKNSKQNDSAELLDLKVKFALMAGNLSQVKADYVDLQRRHYTQDLEVVRLTNLTLELEKKLSALENLKNVNQTMNLLTVKSQLHSLQQTASLLTNNQIARNQDFLALYNIAMTSGKNIKQLQKDFSYDLQILAANQTQKFYEINLQITRTSKDISETNNKLQSIVNDQNVTIMDVYSEIANIKHSISENSRKVALTACSNGITLTNTVALFPMILTNTGIKDIVSFKSTGKFVCEFPGLYFISSNIRSKSDDTSFYLKKNGDKISNSAVTDWPGSIGRTTTGISAAVDCQKNDELYLSVRDSGVLIESTWSCLSVIKIK